MILKKRYANWLKVLFIILIPTIFNSQNLCAQTDLLKEALKVVDEVNNTLLDFTALTDEEENEIGKQLDEMIMEDNEEVNNSKFNVEKIFGEIVKHVDRTELNYSYRIVESEDVNAYTVAGGKIYINTGLLDYLDNEDELAFVIGHEISHNELKHCIKKIQYAAIAGSIDPTLGQVVGVAYSIYDMPFSSDKEFEADENGIYLIHKAGYDKSGAISFFEKLAELEKEYGVDKRDPMNDFISSHPTADKRAERIKNMELEQ